MVQRAARLAFAGLAPLALAGCPQLLGLFGPLPEEQLQIQMLRGMQQAVMPATNADLAYLLRGLNEILGYGLPTFYGVDLAKYLQLAPFPPAPALNKSIVALPKQAGDPENELGLLQGPDPSRQYVRFVFNEDKLPQPPIKSLSYLVSVDRSQEFVTGTLTVQTTDLISMQKKSPPKGQPHAPYTFGRGYLAQTPNNISASVALNRQGSRLADVRVTLSKGTEPQVGELLANISVSGSLTSKIDFNLQGKVNAGGISMNGDMGIADAQGNRQELQVQYIRMDSKNLRFLADGIQQKLLIELELEDGKLSGYAQSTNPDYQRNLAVVTQQGAQAQVKYIDRSGPEPWR
ncbi:MAG: hypothetical protein FJZ01_24635 [Candidatus Sericytochromatia bacterium]|nr:hypothetical protein [Candidatus Tanganyikabacteria bacterium]